MILNYRNQLTRDAAAGRYNPRVPRDIAKRARMRLQRIDAAVSLDDLRVPPSHRLELLRGDRFGQYSIRVNQQWRVCFIWEGSNARDVELVDYH